MLDAFYISKIWGKFKVDKNLYRKTIYPWLKKTKTPMLTMVRVSTRLFISSNFGKELKKLSSKHG